MKIQSAFTLIELLVVIAIIAILAAILFPVFASAKEAAKKVQSLSNLKQTVIAWQLYQGDYDDELMRDHILTTLSLKSNWWASCITDPFDPFHSCNSVPADPTGGLLYPYTKSAGVQVDPSFPNAKRTAVGLTGYGYNYVYLSPTNYGPGPTFDEIPVPTNFSDISESSRTVAFGSCARMNTWAYTVPTVEGSALLEPPSSEYPSFQGRHNGVGNIAWCDGHAKSSQPIYRSGMFGFGYNSADFKAAKLGDIDSDGDLTTDELFSLKK